MRSPLAAWAQLLRASNLPTVWSAALGAVGMGALSSDHIQTTPIIQACVALSLIYLGGMALNDVMDAQTDRRERPTRPIPSARISRTTAGVVAGLLLLAGAAVGALQEPGSLPWLLAIVLAVVLYDTVKVRSQRLVALMGACRWLVYPAAASLALSAWDLWPVVGLGGIVAAYTILLTLVARDEASDRRRSVRSTWALPIMPIAIAALAIAVHGVPNQWATAALSLVLIAAVAWLVRARRCSPHDPIGSVMALLAGFCMLDAVVLAVVWRPWLLTASLICFILTVLAHKRIAGT